MITYLCGVNYILNNHKNNLSGTFDSKKDFKTTVENTYSKSKKNNTLKLNIHKVTNFELAELQNTHTHTQQKLSK